MKKLILTLACSVMLAAAAFGQTQTIALTTSGTGNGSGTFVPGNAFSLDANITFSGYTASGLSYWLEVPTALAPYITITSEQYFNFTDANNPGVKTFVDSSGADNAGFLTDKGAADGGDLGATAASAPFNLAAGGPYLMSTLTFTLSGSAPAGTYTIQTTTLIPKRSIVGDTGFTSHPLPSSSYSITVVPEPSTVAFVLGGVGILAANFFRRGRKA